MLFSEARQVPEVAVFWLELSGLGDGFWWSRLTRFIVEIWTLSLTCLNSTSLPTQTVSEIS